jgi:type I restriction enzyme R subunit
MMVEHFHEQVIAKGKMEAGRAMIVTCNIPRCIEY